MFDLKEKFPNVRIAVTGHSAGAAVGSLAAAELTKAGFTVTSYTYGTPMYANQKYFDFMRTRLTDVYFFVNH